MTVFNELVGIGKEMSDDHPDEVERIMGEVSANRNQHMDPTDHHDYTTEDDTDIIARMFDRSDTVLNDPRMRPVMNEAFNTIDRIDQEGFLDCTRLIDTIDDMVTSVDLSDDKRSKIAQLQSFLRQIDLHNTDSTDQALVSICHLGQQVMDQE